MTVIFFFFFPSLPLLSSPLPPPPFGERAPVRRSAEMCLLPLGSGEEVLLGTKCIMLFIVDVAEGY